MNDGDDTDMVMMMMINTVNDGDGGIYAVVVVLEQLL